MSIIKKLLTIVLFPWLLQLAMEYLSEYSWKEKFQLIREFGILELARRQYEAIAAEEAAIAETLQEAASELQLVAQGLHEAAAQLRELVKR